MAFTHEVAAEYQLLVLNLITKTNQEPLLLLCCTACADCFGSELRWRLCLGRFLPTQSLQSGFLRMEIFLRRSLRARLRLDMFLRIRPRLRTPLGAQICPSNLLRTRLVNFASLADSP